MRIKHFFNPYQWFLYIGKCFFCFCLFSIGISSLFAHDSLSVKEIAFIKNCRQWKSNILYKVNLNGGALFMEKNVLTYVFLDGKQQKAFYEAKMNPNVHHSGLISAHAYKVSFLDANSHSTFLECDVLPFYHNYFIGADSSHWASKVPLYQSIICKNLYDGIDLCYTEEEGTLKYEFRVAPFASPNHIKMNYDGDLRISLSNGNLLITTSVNQVMEMKPFVYQFVNGEKKVIDSRYKLRKNTLSFDLGTYDPALPLIIDPTLVFSSYTGSTADNWGFTATYDSEGNVFGGGIAFSVGYPTHTGAYQINFAGGRCDISISKFNSIGNSLMFSTYLGGSANEQPHSLVTNHNGELYLFGTTSSSDFPVLSNSYQSNFSGGTVCAISNSIQYDNGSDIVLVKMNSTGTQLLGSTFVGGTGNDGLNLHSSLYKNYSDEVRGEIILDDNSNVYVTTTSTSTNFPVTANAFQLLPAQGGDQDAVIFKMNHNLTNMIWSSYLGGSGQDAGYSLVLKRDNSVFFCGGTTSLDLNVTGNCFQPTFGGGVSDGFVAHVSADGSILQNCSYLGKMGYDQAYLIKSDKQDNPYLYGQTDDTLHHWVYNAAWYYGNGQFLTKMDPTLSNVIWSTEFGTLNAGPDISPTALLVDLCNKIYMSGWGTPLINQFGGTSGLPITFDAYQNTTDNNDYYFICISDDASSLEYATYFGSPNPSAREHVDGGTSRFDTKGRIYQAVCAGCGGLSSFPTTPGAWSNINGSSNCNLAVVKMDFNLPVIVADFNIPTTVCAPISLFFDNQSQTISENSTYHWNFGDGTTSTLESPSHTYNFPGIYVIQLIIQDASSCNFADTVYHTLLVLANTTTFLDSVEFCIGDQVQIGTIPAADDQVTYHWEPTTGLSNPNISNPITSPVQPTLYTLYISNGICFDTIKQWVSPILLDDTLPDIVYCCENDNVTLNPGISDTVDCFFYWSTTTDFSTLLNNNFHQASYSFIPNQDTTFLYLKITKGDCERINTVCVIVDHIYVLLPEMLIHCFTDTAQMEMSAFGDYTYQWFPQEYVVSGGNTTNPWIAPPTSTDFTVFITNSTGCTSTYSVYVVKQEGTFPSPFEAWASENDIFLGDSIILFSTEYTDNVYTYQWIPAADLVSPNSPITIATPQETTVFWAVVTDVFGCTMQDTVFVKVTERFCGDPLIFIPNAFTPNGDQRNDVLYVRSEILESFVFRIYNRWGELIFATENQEEGWNGKYKGKECPAGVYDYYFEGTCLGNNRSVYKTKGNITLIR